MRGHSFAHHGPMKINDAIFGAIFAVLGAIVLWYVQSFPTIPGQQYGPGLFPGSIAAGFLVCGVMLVINGLRRREGGWITFGDWTRSAPHIRRLLAVVLGVVAYILVGERVGFLLFAPLLLIVLLRVFGVRWTTTLAAAFAATLLIWYVFYKLLRVPLPWGVLTPYAF